MTNICAFKILPKNETAAGLGHQAGFLITKPMRTIFPELDLELPPDRPTRSVTLDLTLVVDGYTIDRVRSRYQFQTWGNTRRPEYRLTNGLYSLLSAALPGDMLVIYPSREQADRMTAEVIRQNTEAFSQLLKATQGQHSGVVQVPRQITRGRHQFLQRAVEELQEAAEDMPFGRGHNQPPELIVENPLNEDDRRRLENIVERLSAVEERIENKSPEVSEAQRDIEDLRTKLARFMAQSTGKAIDAFMVSFGKTLGPVAAIGVPAYIVSAHEKLAKVIATLEPWLASLNLF